MGFSYEQEQLINLYSEYPNLWNTKDKDYRNKHMRKIKLEEIGAKLGFSAKDINEKFRNLRIAFTRELRMVKAKKSGDGAQDVYHPRWKHYNKMLFLCDTIAADESCSNFDKQLNESPDFCSTDDIDNNFANMDAISSPSASSYSSSPSTSASVGRKRKFSKEDKATLIETAAKVLCGPEEDDVMLWCKGLASSMRKIDPSNQEIAKFEIQQIILKHLNRNIFIINRISNFVKNYR